MVCSTQGLQFDEREWAGARPRPQIRKFASDNKRFCLIRPTFVLTGSDIQSNKSGESSHWPEWQHVIYAHIINVRYYFHLACWLSPQYVAV